MTAINLKLKFRGTKEILFEEDFGEEHKETIEEFWAKLFGGYRVPICPLCKINMNLRRCNVTKQVSLGAHYGSKRLFPIAGPEEIALNFVCPQCGSEIFGWGIGFTINMKAKWFSVEKFGVVSFKVSVR